MENVAETNKVRKYSDEECLIVTRCSAPEIWLKPARNNTRAISSTIEYRSETNEQIDEDEKQRRERIPASLTYGEKIASDKMEREMVPAYYLYPSSDYTSVQNDDPTQRLY